MRKQPKLAMRKGVALLLVVLLAFVAFAALTGLVGSLAARNRTVKGSAVADRALAVADGSVDQVLTAINRLGFAFGSISASGTTEEAATTAVVNKALADINGGTVGGTRVIYVNASSGDMYTTGTGSNAGKLVKWPVETTGEVVVNDLISSLDAHYNTDNQWFQVNVQTVYRQDPDIPDAWTIKATAFNASTPAIQRTVLAQARQGDIATEQTLDTTKANGTWYTYQSSTTTTPHFFCDYSGMYGDDSFFGTYEVTEGPVFAAGNLHMGGWAKDPVYASGSVYDDALDGGSHAGRFGPADNKGKAESLKWAKKNGYANGEQGVPSWPNGDKALYGSSISKRGTDTGMQDVCLPSYYISGGTNNTVVFSVEGGIGKVMINGTKMDLPSNGIIYVDGGNVTVSGTIKGRVTIGAGPTRYGDYGDIYIGGNIVYNTPPRNNPNDPIPAVPDALGLVAYDDIIIPTSTYDTNRTLQVDAALMCVHGSFHIDSNASSHYVSSDPSQQYTGWWNGAQASYSTDEVPCVTSQNWWGTEARGYEAQHTRFDYNLLNYGAPPMFPSTNPGSTTINDNRFVPVPEDNSVLLQLRQLKKADVVALSPAMVDDHGQQMFYKYVIGGVTYYYGSQFGVTTTGYSATYTASQLYRIVWREVIGSPVASPSSPSAE